MKLGRVFALCALALGIGCSPRPFAPAEDADEEAVSPPSSSTGSVDEVDCPSGEANCPCELGSCHAGLTCNSGLCVFESEDSGDEESGSTTSVFLPAEDSLPLNCDLWTHEDCPVGTKCMPYAAGGEGYWNASRCTPVQENPKQYADDCTAAERGLLGEDDCDVGLICGFVDEKGQGVCLEQCSGSPSQPICSPGHSCGLTSDGVYNICERVCDPLGDECTDLSPHSVCVHDGGGRQFSCASGWGEDAISIGQPCRFINSCAPRSFCARPEEVPGCRDEPEGCCSPFCRLDGDGHECLPGQSCEPWFESVEPAYEHVGACVVPE